MKIPERGMDRDELFKKLKSFRTKDVDIGSGKMFGHAFLVDDDTKAVVELAYIEYLWENALDPTLFESTMLIEKELVSMAAEHLGGDKEVTGNFTSGGTESILLAVKAARDKARAERPEISKPEMILPVTAHGAFHKAARYFCLEVVSVPVNMETFRAEAKAIEEAITDNTVLIVASAPSYAHGVMDDIPAIGKLAAKRNIPLHIDGCMGAFLLPYYRELGVDFIDFDFSVPGVTSISMDFHKYAFAAKGASVVLFKNRDLRRYAMFACSDWTGYTLLNPTVQSSRSGGPMAAAWAALNYIGHEGYLEVTRELIRAAEKLMRGISEIEGLYILGKPEFCIFSASSDTVSVFRLVEEMRKRGWHIQAQFGLGPYKENFHFSMMPLNVKMIDACLKDLSECVEIAKKFEPSKLAAELKKGFAGTDGSQVSDADIDEMFKSVGIGGEGVPESMAEINEILNVLPPKLADRVLIKYYNEIS